MARFWAQYPVILYRSANGSRIPAHDLAAEAGLLGAMLLRGEAVDLVSVVVTPADFYKPAHAHVYDATLSVHSSGTPADPVTVADELSRSGLLADIGGPATLLDLQSNGVPISSVRKYADIVARHSRNRRALSEALEATEALWNGDLDQAAKHAQAVVDTTAGFHRSTSGLVLPDAVEWPDFWTREHLGAQWLVEPIIPMGRLVSIYAQHKVGKSLLLLDIAAALAAGRPVLGGPCAERQHVLYLDLEMAYEDVRERLEDLGYGPDADLSCLHYYSLPSLPPLDTAEGGRVLRELANRDEAQLVVIDTMAQGVSGDENSADTYRAFARHTGKPLKADGITVTRLDHAGKDLTKGQRGTSAKGDDVDLVWRLSPADSQALMLHREDHRVPWVPDKVTLNRHEEPFLRHVLSPYAWPAGTAEVAQLLADLDVSPEASVRAAMGLLREAGQGRRTEVVGAALRYLRGRRRDA